MKGTAQTVYALNKQLMNYITVDVVHRCFVSKVDGDEIMFQRRCDDR